MPTASHNQTTLSAGEFDPLLWSREDVSFFYNSARIIENAVPLPQGGVKRREGWRYRSVQRGAISAIDLTGKTVTATNGGAAANGIDGDTTTFVETTANIGTATIYEVFRIDMGAATEAALVDLTGLATVGLPSSLKGLSFAVQTSADATTWTTAHQIKVGNAAYNRRFGAKPDTLLGDAQYWRLVALNPDAVDLSSTTVKFSEFKMWTEAGYSASGATVGNFSLHRLTTDVSNEYTIWLSAGCADVFRADTGAWVACLDMPHTNAQVGQIKNSPNLDTVIFYHMDVAPWLIQRLGSDADWRSSAVAFDTVVQFPFSDDDVSGGNNEIHLLRFSNMSNGDELVVEFNGEISSKITWTNNEVTNAASIKTAVESLEDFDLVSVTADGSGVNAALEIEYQGSKENTPVAIMIVDILTGTGTVEASRIQYGHPPTDPLWSETRGYPRCGAFYQGRHWMGGFRSRSDLIVASRVGALFDFKEDADPVAGSPIVVAPNVDDQITVHNIYPGRHLQIFTSSAEMYIPDEPITIDNIALKTTSRHGANEYTQPVDIQGGTLFSDRNGRALREYLFQDAQQSYSAEPVSFLAGHLMAQPQSLVMRRARDVDEPTLLLLANTGVDRAGNTVPAAMCVIDRAQQVTGFFRVKTDGTPLGFSTSQGGDAFAVTRRALAGNEWNYLEQFDDECMSDAGVKISGAGDSIDLTGIAEHLNGQTVYVHVDGLPVGDFTVTNNQIDLGDESYTAEAEVGLKMVPRIVLHPYKWRGEAPPTMSRMRLFAALLRVERTGGLAVGIHGQSIKPLSFQNYDSGTFDPTLSEILFSGEKRVKGLSGWDGEPCLEITQIDPVPFLLRSVLYQIKY